MFRDSVKDDLFDGVLDVMPLFSNIVPLVYMDTFLCVCITLKLNMIVVGVSEYMFKRTTGLRLCFI